jgi:UDP-GlcNAc3NAcA epimerase
LKIVSVIGARPQMIKASAVSRALRKEHEEFLVHTGQHYDYEMSDIFFKGLDLPSADINLNVGSGSHGAQTGAMLSRIETILQGEKPDYLLIYGDTNSTIAGALAAAKLCVKVVHVEAGLRSFNRKMPEEVNRVVADHLSTLLLCTSDEGVRNLSAEGITKGVHVVGDVMADVMKWAQKRLAIEPAFVLDDLALEPRNYLLATVHRSENTDDPERLAHILDAFNSIDELLVFPVHPRTKKLIREGNYALKPNIKLINPVGYFEMVTLTSNARLVLTDSGGLQKEAYWLGIPCLTMRNETEWVETVEAGWNVLVGSDSAKILESVRSFAPPQKHPVLYGDGHASERCVELLRSPVVDQEAVLSASN